MKKIGLLGGMSWESTAEYYRLLNVLVREERGGLHSAELVLISVDFAEIEALQVSGRWDEAGRLLADLATQVEQAGAEVVLLCTNTMHKVADTIEAALGVPFLHLVDATADEAHRLGLTRLGLLATGFTMEQSFYRDRMEARGLQTVVPGVEDREVVHGVIYEELCRGIFRDESREALGRVIGRLASEGCDAVILGCTELELLIAEQDSSLPVLASTQLHAKAAVAFACALDLSPGDDGVREWQRTARGRPSKA